MKPFNTATIERDYNTLLLKWGNHSKELQCGSSDDICGVYRDKERVYVLSENHHLDYVALETFNIETGYSDFDIFYDGRNDDIERVLNWKRPTTKINYLLQWDM